jgi:hypothetical protein
MFVANNSLFGGIISKILLREEDIDTIEGTTSGSLGRGMFGGIAGEMPGEGRGMFGGIAGEMPGGGIAGAIITGLYAEATLLLFLRRIIKYIEISKTEIIADTHIIRLSIFIYSHT